jgi:Ser/Thr protein kinase RdoA (MazF antagonist)
MRYTQGMHPDHRDLSGVFGAWDLGSASATPITSGHINQTFLVQAPTQAGAFVLQRLSPIFGPEVNLDIDTITARLAAQGLRTPRLVPTADGLLWHTDEEQRIWRLMTYIEGEIIDQADSAERCREAAGLLGRFHLALWDLDYQPRHRRLGVHDTPRHLANLERALEEHRSHRLYIKIGPVGQQILEAASRLRLPDNLPQRLVHGDPKITNVIFDSGGQALCLVDLDTVARMPLPVELGDALRSWCSPKGEEVEGPLDLAFFRAAVQGYAATVQHRPTPHEREMIADTTEVIAVELAARFCADALQESYFGWDRQRFDSAAEHNLVRARSQLSLARSLRQNMSRLRLIVADAWKVSR